MKMRTKAIIITAILFHLILPQINNTCKSACCTGCLKCVKSTENPLEHICEICDFIRYKKVNGLCILLKNQPNYTKNYKNCLKVGPEGKCGRCQLHFMVNDQGLCEKVKIEIANCYEYTKENGNYRCSQCLNNHVMGKERCERITTTRSPNPMIKFIQNCRLYTNKGKCRMCDRGFVVGLKQKSCIKISNKKCLTFSYMNCQDCKDGFIKSGFKRYEDLFRDDSLLLRSLYNLNFALDTKIQYFPLCKKLIQGCEHYSGENQCGKCTGGYFLDKNICSLTKKIDPQNCLYRDQYGLCVKCYEHYYLNQSKQCIGKLPILDCEVHRHNLNSEGELICLKCKQANSAGKHLVLIGNKCTLVQQGDFIELENCIEYQEREVTEKGENGQLVRVKKVECVKCKESYIINNISSSCHLKLLNCLQHGFQCRGQQNNTDGKCTPGCSDCEVKCMFCDIKFYTLQGDLNCKQGTIANCEYYVQLQTIQTCQTCKNGFRLENNQNNQGSNDQKGICTAQETIEKCAVYHNVDKNVCLKGQQNYLPIWSNSKCRELDPEINSADKIAFITDFQENCQELKINDIKLASKETYQFPICSICKENKIPISFVEKNICIPKTLISSNEEENCNYKVKVTQNLTTKTEYKCFECKNNYFYQLKALNVWGCANDQCDSDQNILNPNSYLVNHIRFNQSDGNNDFTQKCERRVPKFEYCKNIDQIERFKGENISQVLKVCTSCRNNLPKMVLIHKSDGQQKGVLNLSQDLQNSNTYENMLNFPIFDIPFYTCIQEPDIKINNCEFYNNGLKKGQCFRCKFGYKANLNTMYYQRQDQKIISCTLNENMTCQQEKRPGIPGALQLLGICQCEANELSYVQIDQPFRDPNRLSLNIVKQYQASCTNLNIYNKLTKQELIDLVNVDNCGLVLIYKLLIVGGANQNSYYCGSCEPGYRIANRHQTYSFIITKCFKIPNCDLNNPKDQWFNGCKKCKTGFGFQRNNGAFGKVTNNCVSMSVTGCLIRQEDGECLACQKGYFLREQKCRKIVVKRCDEDSIYFSQIIYYGEEGFQYPIQFDLKYKGTQLCSHCTNDTDDLVKVDFNYDQCLSQQFLNAKNILEEKEECTAFTLNEDYLNPSVLRPPGYKCIQCRSKMYLNGKCSGSFGLDNCLQKQDKITGEGSECVLCKEGYSVFEDICIPSRFENCIKESNLACLICKKGYYLGKFANGETFCYKNFESQKALNQNKSIDRCLRFVERVEIISSENAQNDQQYPVITCELCENNLYVELLENNYYKFMRYKEIEHCEEYMINNQAKNSQPGCKLCKNDKTVKTYQAEQKCNIRKNLDPNCEIFYKNEDYCEKCRDSAYFEISIKLCKNKPLIPNCLDYKSELECNKCTNVSFIADCQFNSFSRDLCARFGVKNVCISIEKSELVEHCVKYNNEKKCLKCEDIFGGDSYFLKSDTNICQVSQVKNCKQQKDETTCKVCEHKHYLVKNNNLTNCERNRTNNCVFFSKSFVEKHPEKSGQCKACGENEIVNNSEPQGKCEILPSFQKIPNCIFYQKNSAEEVPYCIQCKRGIVLNKNAITKKDICSFQDEEDHMSDCQRIVLSDTGLDKPICSSCEFGYYLNQEFDCKTCSSAGVKNCWICEIIGESKKCRICQVGYYMDNKWDCVKNQY